MTAAQYLISALEEQGVEVVFGHPGGAIMPVYDALVGSRLRHVLTRHEQGAAMAADGYARATGRVGVCLATSGPGATNLVTGIANAHMDSIPVVAITGQVPTTLMGTDAFQEVDVLAITMPVVKHAFLVRNVQALPHMVEEAFRLARSGRPGPVLIDLPKDVACATLAAAPGHPATSCEAGKQRPSPAPLPDPSAVDRALSLLRKSRRPLLYAGGGIGLGRLVEPFRELVEATRMPVVTTLKGLGALPGGHELFLGMLGMHGSRAANLAVQDCDLLVCIGARFDDRATGKLSEFAARARVIHMDIDPGEIGKLRSVDASIVGDLRAALRTLAVPLRIDEWRRRCLERKERHAWNYDAPGPGIYGPGFLKALSEAAGEESVVVCDVGQHQMWVAQHWRVGRPELHLSSGGLGAMGFGLPAAIGAQLGLPDRTVILVSGDGSFMMNVQELATVKRCGLPIKIVLFDNQSLGLVRQWQELFFGARYSEVDLSDNPDFVSLAEAFDVAAFRLQRRQEAAAAIDRLLQAPGPILAHVAIDPEANVWPLVRPGASNADMMEGAHR